MKIIFNAGDKVKVKGYHTEGTVNVTFTTETRDFGCAAVRVQIGDVEVMAPSEDVTAVEAEKHVLRVVSSRPMTETERLYSGRTSSRPVVGELRTSYGKTISLS